MGREGDVENGNWAAQQQSMNLMQNAPPAINTGRGNGNAHAGAASGSYNQQYHHHQQQQHQDHHRTNYGTNHGGRSPNGGQMDESLIDRDCENTAKVRKGFAGTRALEFLGLP